MARRCWSKSPAKPEAGSSRSRTASPIDKIYAEIQEDLRSQYSIGYTPDPPSQGGIYRHIHLTAKKKNMTVATREGYYAT